MIGRHQPSVWNKSIMHLLFSVPTMVYTVVSACILVAKATMSTNAPCDNMRSRLLLYILCFLYHMYTEAHFWWTEYMLCFICWFILHNYYIGLGKYLHHYILIKMSIGILRRWNEQCLVAKVQIRGGFG
jgi:hypothetical protein